MELSPGTIRGEQSKVPKAGPVRGTAWVVAYDEEDGMAYYFNQETEESVWEMPGEVFQALATTVSDETDSTDGVQPPPAAEWAAAHWNAPTEDTSPAPRSLVLAREIAAGPPRQSGSGSQQPLQLLDDYKAALRTASGESLDEILREHKRAMRYISRGDHWREIEEAETANGRRQTVGGPFDERKQGNRTKQSQASEWLEKSLRQIVREEVEGPPASSATSSTVSGDEMGPWGGGGPDDDAGSMIGDLVAQLQRRGVGNPRDDPAMASLLLSLAGRRPGAPGSAAATDGAAPPDSEPFEGILADTEGPSELDLSTPAPGAFRRPWRAP
jgi:hypothetical protein